MGQKKHWFKHMNTDIAQKRVAYFSLVWLYVNYVIVTEWVSVSWWGGVSSC